MMADKLVTIAEFINYIDAELAKQTLASNGIEAAILGANAANLYSISTIAKIELQVLEDKAKEASEILKPSQ